MPCLWYAEPLRASQAVTEHKCRLSDYEVVVVVVQAVVLEDSVMLGHECECPVVGTLRYQRTRWVVRELEAAR